MMRPKSFAACLLLAAFAGQAVVAQGTPQNDGSKNGADVANDITAAGQDQDDMRSNADAVGENLLGMQGSPGPTGGPTDPTGGANKPATAAATGGKGGVDPATGETLLPLPEVSEFCKGTGQTPSDGTQQISGSCSSLPQGQIPSVDKMVSTIIVEPQNQAKLPLGQDFQVSVITANMKTGFFDAAQTEYYTQPQTLDEQGAVKGNVIIHFTALFFSFLMPAFPKLLTAQTGPLLGPLLCRQDTSTSPSRELLTRRGHRTPTRSSSSKCGRREFPLDKGVVEGGGH
ncbi:MAG: hypothetical protein BJ554DRAFT_351, partial [Olpidium bornovanus]